MIRTAVKEGSPGDDKKGWSFKLQWMKHQTLPEQSESLEVRSKGRLVEVSGLELAAAVKVGLRDGECGQSWLTWRDSHNSSWKSQERTVQSTWQEESEFEGNEEITAQELAKLWSRIKPGSWTQEEVHTQGGHTTVLMETSSLSSPEGFHCLEDQVFCGRLRPG